MVDTELSSSSAANFDPPFFPANTWEREKHAQEEEEE